MSTAVVVVTYRRPEQIEVCLGHLAELEHPVDEIVVVDSSNDDLTDKLVGRFPGVAYVRNPAGQGHMTASRNIGYRVTTSEIVAYIDDDAYVAREWHACLVAAYSTQDIGAVGGRALNRGVGHSGLPADGIGRILDDGSIVGNFDYDPEGARDVDHLIGCNMSFRRSVLDQLGGFREHFPGTALREDTDMGLRVRGLGYRIVFEPRAVVDHFGAPHAKGRRFDLRYQYYAQRNHVAMLVWNFGLAGRTRRYLVGSCRVTSRSLGVAMLKTGVWVAATTVGMVSGLVHRRSRVGIRRR
jgi:GT2 family glycosyltransferase